MFIMCDCGNHVLKSNSAPVRDFGLFMALLILCNYVLAITWFPAVIILWHKRRPKEEGKEEAVTESSVVAVGESMSVEEEATDKCICGQEGKGNEELDDVAGVDEVDDVGQSDHGTDGVVDSEFPQHEENDECPKPKESESLDNGKGEMSTVCTSSKQVDDEKLDEKGSENVAPLTMTTAASKLQEEEDAKKTRKMEIYFRDYHAQFVYKYRFVILAAFAVLTLLGIYFSLSLEPSEVCPAMSFVAHD
jgi:hypothetical protein